MRRSAKAAPRTFGCVVALALAAGLGAAVPAMADEVAAPYEGGPPGFRAGRELAGLGRLRVDGGFRGLSDDSSE